MTNDAIIFDIDGTLWNACPASAKGINIALKKLGIDKQFTSQQIENISGQPYMHGIDILLPDIEKTPSMLDTLNKCEMEIVKNEGGKFYDGVIEGIKELASSYAIFLVSNCQDWYLNVFLDFTGLRPVFVGFDCNGMSGLSKGDMLRKIKSNYSLNNPVYIGDTVGDQNAANLANMEFIYASYGFGKTEKEAKTFDSFAALLDYLRGRKNNI